MAPPSTGNATPEMKPASVRYSTASTTSLVLAVRPDGDSVLKKVREFS
ncbi:hypothetical protein [Collimonas fungivorans]